MTIRLDRDAERYLLGRREHSAMSSAVLDAAALRAEERNLRHRYGHGPRMWSESSQPASGDVPRHHILDPVESAVGELIYIHGGGWVMGEPEDYLAVCRALAHASGWRVVVPDYRKAPEHPFPAGLDDARAVVGHRLSIRSSDAEPIPFGVGGDSAGGCIAAVLAGEHSAAVSVQVLITPVLDSDLDTPSYLDPQRQLTLTREVMAWFWDQYRPGGDRTDARLAPLRSTRLADLPPTVFVSVGTDVLKSEGDAYLQRLRSAGVDVRHRDFPGQLHGFFQLHNVMAASAEAVDWIAGELRRVSSPGRTALVETGGHQ
ncbi:alpha/beta hydrolase [Microbacterium soli]|uniref:Alpha/beta hydrolase n=1 Tax=Microbacterium soli TaxID=446075 RepID=A0ABP7N4E1_9MICO